MGLVSALDIRSWIYELTEDTRIGSDEDDDEKSNGKKGFYGTNRGNFLKIFSETQTIFVGAEQVELPPRSEIVVYQKLTRSSKGHGWVGTSSSLTLAVIFVKQGDKTVEQIKVLMNGRIIRKRFV
jgi:hypothetical protein